HPLPLSLFPYTTLFRSPHACPCARPSDTIVSVLWGRSAFHPLLRREAQLSDRKLSLSVGARLLVAPRVFFLRAGRSRSGAVPGRSEEHTSELQSRSDLV